MGWFQITYALCSDKTDYWRLALLTQKAFNKSLPPEWLVILANDKASANHNQALTTKNTLTLVTQILCVTLTTNSHSEDSEDDSTLQHFCIFLEATNEAKGAHSTGNQSIKHDLKSGLGFDYSLARQVCPNSNYCDICMTIYNKKLRANRTLMTVYQYSSSKMNK